MTDGLELTQIQNVCDGHALHQNQALYGDSLLALWLNMHQKVLREYMSLDRSVSSLYPPQHHHRESTSPDKKRAQEEQGRLSKQLDSSIRMPEDFEELTGHVTPVSEAEAHSLLPGSCGKRSQRSQSGRSHQDGQRGTVHFQLPRATGSVGCDSGAVGNEQSEG